LRSDKRGNARKSRDLRVRPDADVAVRDAAAGFDRARLDEHDARTALRELAQVHEMPVVHQALGRTVLAHRRDHDAVLRAHLAQAERFKKLGRGHFFQRPIFASRALEHRAALGKAGADAAEQHPFELLDEILTNRDYRFFKRGRSKMSSAVSKFCFRFASTVSVALLTTSASAQDATIHWKMQSAFAGNLPHLGTSGVRFSKDIERMSGGKFDVKFFEPGALIPPLECFDSVAKGAIEACWTTPGYHTGKYPAAAFFTTVPFGPGFGEFLAWKWYGGGNKLRDEIYAKHGLMAVEAFCIGPETSGWFRKEVTSLSQLKGMKMRFFGLGAQVMQKLGVSTQ